MSTDFYPGDVVRIGNGKDLHDVAEKPFQDLADEGNTAVWSHTTGTHREVSTSRLRLVESLAYRPGDIVRYRTGNDEWTVIDGRVVNAAVNFPRVCVRVRSTNGQIRTTPLTDVTLVRRAEDLPRPTFSEPVDVPTYIPGDIVHTPEDPYEWVVLRNDVPSDDPIDMSLRARIYNVEKRRTRLVALCDLTLVRRAELPEGTRVDLGTGEEKCPHGVPFDPSTAVASDACQTCAEVWEATSAVNCAVIEQGQHYPDAAVRMAVPDSGGYVHEHYREGLAHTSGWAENIARSQITMAEPVRDHDIDAGPLPWAV